MFKKFILLIAAILFLFAGNLWTGVNAQETKRVYFKIKNSNGLSAILPFIHHSFNDEVFSVQLPASDINKLKNDPNLIYKGEAVLWKITDSILPELPNIPEVATIQRRNNNPSPVCNPTTTTPWGVKKINGGSGGDNITVAVIDTGIKTDHPDLKDKIVDCRDAQTSSLRNRCADANGHGTHVAGTIAANGKILGVAPNAKIAAIQVCSSGGYCWSDDVARGIRYAADKGYKVINISLGGSTITSIELDAIDYAISKGSLVIAAAGNSGPKLNSINYPAAYSKVVAVAAMQDNNQIATFSSRGINPGQVAYSVEEREIELSAPGVNVESTYNNGCYAFGSGTSMAAPHISGLAAKLWQGDAQSTRNFLQLRAKLNDIDVTGDDPASGFGLPSAP